MPLFIASAVGDAFSVLIISVITLAFFAAVIASAVWFFRGPANAAERYVDSLALQLNDPQAAVLFRNIYRTKEPRSTTLAWILTALLSPTIGYLYQKKWLLAVLSFVTLQGFLIWWLVALFTTPIEVVATNKRLADEAFNQVMIGRGFGTGQQVINVNQYAYMPHPGGVVQGEAVPNAFNPNQPPVVTNLSQPSTAIAPVPQLPPETLT